MNVMICDDDYSVCVFIENTILEYAKQKNIDIKVDITQSKQELFNNYEEDLDLLFLDIMLPDSSGVDIGHFLRKNSTNLDLQIVFISSNPGYALELFKIRPMDFLVKPFEKIDVIEILDDYFRIRMPQMNYFTYKSKQSSGKILYKDILYFSSNIRKVDIYLNNGRSVSIYGKLSEIEEKIPSDHFLRIHQSFIVNKHYIDNCQYDCVRLTNDEILPISKNYRKEIRNKILNE